MIEAHVKILLGVKEATIASLTTLAAGALKEGAGNIEIESRAFKESQNLLEARDVILRRFADRLGAGFDQLLGAQSGESAPNYSGLSLMNDDELESVIAMEGMIAHARNCDITEYLSFTTRLNALYYANLVDESNNPLDPAQIGEAFKLAMQKVEVGPQSLLTVYRAFNRQVFHNLESVLGQANQLLREEGIIPELGIAGRNRNEVRNKRSNSRERTDPNERAFRVVEESRKQASGSHDAVFTLLQRLIRNDTHKAAMSSHVHDSIAVTDLLYRAIQDDVTVPERIRHQILRTPLTLLQIVDQDSSFWNDVTHPARRLLGELAEARLSLTLLDNIQDDPLFERAVETIDELVDGYAGDLSIVESQLQAFGDFRQELLAGLQEQTEEPGPASAELSQKRLEAARAYALHKIIERMAGQDVPEVVRLLLEGHFRDFLVEVLLTHGPGGDNWKTIMNTIDTLLWSVKPGKDRDDRELLAQINKRLMSNLGKALRVARVERKARGTLLRQLEAAQQESFEKRSSAEDAVIESVQSPEESPRAADVEIDAAEFAEDDLYWREVNKYPIGIWMEFDVAGTHTIRCTLAARIESVDEFVFVNKQGVKVVGKSRAGLAQEVRDGTARVIYDSPLIDRAIDTMIARLRGKQNDAPAVRQQG